MNAWAPIIFFEGEDEAVLRERFIALSAKHKEYFTAVDICQHIFADLKEPQLRAVQAAAVWSRDIGIQEAIRQRILEGPESGEFGKKELIQRSMAIADNPSLDAKDRLAALRLAAELQTLIVKPSTIDIGSKSGQGMPMFNIVRYADVEPASG